MKIASPVLRGPLRSNARGLPDQVIRSGGSPKLFGAVYAPSTLGMFLREFTHGHTRELAAVLTRHLLALVQRTAVLTGLDVQAFIDIDFLLRPVYGYAKQGASFGHTKIANRRVLRKGLSTLVTTISTATAAPMIGGVRLRAGKAGSGRGAASMVTNSAWTILGAIAHNLLCAAGALIHTAHAVARGATLRRRMVNVPARIARPQGRRVLHLPTHHPHQH